MIDEEQLAIPTSSWHVNEIVVAVLCQPPTAAGNLDDVIVGTTTSIV
jgi:hypothetical protein